jgi:hypothetical protein
LQEIVSAFEQVLDTLNDFVAREAWIHDKKDWQEPLVGDCERLLYTMFEHLNYCRNILLCLLPSDDSLKANVHVKEFDKGIKPYRDHIGAVVNRIKHGQRRIRAFVFYEGGPPIPGYYLETVGTLLEGGKSLDVMQPDPEIHSNADTGFSLHRDLRYHFANLYLIARRLARAVSGLKGNEDAARVRDDDMDTRLFNVARRMGDLPAVFFPDELRKPVPAVGAVENEEARTLWVDYPSLRFRPSTMRKARITVGWMGDGVTKTFKLPYALPASWKA